MLIYCPSIPDSSWSPSLSIVYHVWGNIRNIWYDLLFFMSYLCLLLVIRSCHDCVTPNTTRPSLGFTPGSISPRMLAMRPQKSYRCPLDVWLVGQVLKWGNWLTSSQGCLIDWLVYRWLLRQTTSSIVPPNLATSRPCRYKKNVRIFWYTSPWAARSCAGDGAGTPWMVLHGGYHYFIKNERTTSSKQGG